MRIVNHPLLGSNPNKETIHIYFNGQPYQALTGDSIASALLANGIRTLRLSEKNQEPRGIYCGIGHCFECRVTVNGIPSIRACITPVQDQMMIESQRRSVHES